MPESFECEQPFYIDNGELAGVSREMAFVLGFEFCSVYMLLDAGEEFETAFHAENRDRLSRMCERYGVKFHITHHDDWPVLHVGF